ncbi:MAG: hypothetical protein FWE76_08780, partial [Symbiobacteriaceae bacterium]|nr:hypothetical protein [Symbiobacteriaceae bacterium]
VDAEVDVSFEAPDFAEIDSIELDLPEADMIELPAGEALDIDSETLPHGITTSDSMPANDPGLRLFTMRSLVAFFALAGWSGLIALQNRWGLPMVFAAAFVAGAIGSYTVAKIMQLALRLQDKGNINLENAISMQAEVYIRIPASTQGVGKVTLVIQERFLETDAVTRHTADLHPGESVRVVGLQDENTLIVRPI